MQTSDIKLTPTDWKALNWLAEHDGGSPGARIASGTLSRLRAFGLADPNRPGARRLQDDHWWLTERGLDVAGKAIHDQKTDCQ